jgi:hypothetical protein
MPKLPDPATSGVPDHAHAYLQLLLIPLAALIAVMPIIDHGCSCGHDFDFHLLNWMEAARQFSLGNLHPQWAFTPAFNAGEPRFVFYPPLSWTLGALLGLLLTHLPGVSEAVAWSAVPTLFTWIALTVSGLTMYRLARLFVSSNAALLAATIYLANPYMLFTAYERTAYAELLAAAWIPLLLHAILRRCVTIPRIALPVALLWITNAPAAVMGSYMLALLATVRILLSNRGSATANAPAFATENWPERQGDSLQLAFKTIAGTALGLGLAAFYIFPAAYERRFVQIAMATIAGMRIDQNFLFEHTGTSPDALLHDQVLHTASIIAVVLLAATAIALATTLLRKPKSASIFPILPLAVLTAAIAVLLTPLSLPLWNHAPQAVFLQFPWRLLAILAPAFALSLAAALSCFPFKFIPTAILAALFAIALTYPAYHAFRQPCDPEDTAPARLALFHSNAGTDPTDEYTPTDADNDSLNPNDPPYWLAASPTDGPPAAVQPGPFAQPGPAAALPGATPMHFTIAAPLAEDLVVNLRDYPAWRISRNGVYDPTRAPRSDGLIAIPIPAGSSVIDIHYTHTLDETLGDALSLLSLLSIVVVAVVLRTPSSP